MQSVIFVSYIFLLFLFDLSSASLLLPSRSSLAMTEAVNVNGDHRHSALNANDRHSAIDVCKAFTTWSYCPGSPTDLVKLTDFTILVCPPYIMSGWSFSLAETHTNFLVSVIGQQSVIGAYSNIQTADTMTVNAVSTFMANTSYYFVTRDLTIGLPSGTYQANQIWTDPLGKPFMCIYYAITL